MKKIIIVCDEKRREFADYLAQLVSLSDDTEDTTVGVKDGSVAAQVWLEKHYESNSATISSDQYILFVGNSKLVKEKSSRKSDCNNSEYFHVWFNRLRFLKM